MTFTVENGQENGILGRHRIYTGYGVKKAYADGKIYVHLIDKVVFSSTVLIDGNCHVDGV